MSTRPNNIDDDTRRTHAVPAARAMWTTLQSAGYVVGPNDAGRIINTMIDAMAAARTLDTVERELSAVMELSHNVTVVSAAEVLTLWELDLRREYNAIKEPRGMCMTIGCRIHYRTDIVTAYCDKHRV